MSARFQFGISLSIVGLLLFGLIMFGYLIQQNQNSVIETDENIEQINASLNNFVQRWDERIKISNEVNNITQRYQIGLADNLTKVVDRLEEAELQRGNITNDILGNLTSHRIVTNETADIARNLANQTLFILNNTQSLTGPEYEKLADKRVESIVGNLTADHEVIMKALNITSDN